MRSSDAIGGPAIGDVAEFVLKHHSAVELVDRAATAGLVRRSPDLDDGRIVRLRLTAAGRDKLERVAIENSGELSKLRLRSEGLDRAIEGCAAYRRSRSTTSDVAQALEPADGQVQVASPLVH